MIGGAFGTEWSVKYNQQEICALKGSTVFMNGTYTHPERLTVTETFWGIDIVKGVELTDLSKDPDYSGRVEYLTDEQKHFSFKLSDVMKKDEHQFCFRIRTNEEKEKWAATPGVQLRVTELHVEAPEEVTEGETADLTCKTTCSLTDPTFIWYKNGHPLTTKTIKNNQLHLQTVSSEDAGSYSCAVREYQHLHSTDEMLYSTITHKPVEAAASADATGGIQNNDMTSTDQQEEPQYASLTFLHRTAATGSPTQNVEDPSVIYSTTIRAAKREYRAKVESQFNTTNIRSLWEELNTITDFKRETRSVNNISAALPDELNTFYARFELKLASGATQDSNSQNSLLHHMTQDLLLLSYQKHDRTPEGACEQVLIEEG
ncbi:uncharacterized protein LOC118797730 [Colossoma macropomum]|uniref:uncharacterized protein LOC118797730 n=1 Tax=Colossoma macropomum TaxID=42526 RepID=UPI0018643113|nr:uncharacterized protein LOC118797730 [Colossoma macropomum]